MSEIEAVQGYLPLRSEDKAVSASHFPTDGYAWGVDTGKRRVAIAAARPPKEVYVDEAVRGGQGESEAVSLIELERLAFNLGVSVIDAGYPPCLVVVEFPFGPNRATEMGASYGAVTLGIHKALRTHDFSRDQLMVVGRPVWAKAVLGKGNVTKAQIKAWAEWWLGGELASQDAADAVAICRWAMGRFE